MAQERGLEDRVAELWSVMEAEVVVAVVQRMGARLYELLTASPTAASGAHVSSIEHFTSHYGDDIRSLFAEFLDPHDQDVREYVLRRLNAQYVIDAAALPQEALTRLSHLGRKAVASMYF